VSIEQLITEHLDIWTAADTEKKSGRGRGSANSGNVYGIKKLRELILELAVRGKLVPQDPNDEPASELLKRIQAEKAKLIAEGKIKKDKPLAPITEEEKPFDLPVGWEWVRLGNVCSYIQRGKGPSYIDKSEFMVISQKCVRWSGLDLSQARFVEPESIIKYESVRFLREGDILWNSTGTGTIGRACIVTIQTNQSVMVADSHVTVVRPISFGNIFLLRWIQSPFVQSKIEEVSSGSTNQIELNTSTVISHVLPLPPLPEQHRIVAKVDELMALCDQLENQHNNAAEAHEKLVAYLLGTLTQSQNAEDFNANWHRIAEHFDTLFTTETSIDELKQTLLQLAVMGKLVPQDPNDEPVINLIHRVKESEALRVKNKEIQKPKKITTDSLPGISIPTSWIFKTLSELAFVTKLAGFEYTEYINLKDEGEVPVIRAQNVRPFLPKTENLKFIDLNTSLDLPRSALDRPSLLVTFIGAGIGDVCLFNDTRRWHLAPNVAKVEPFADFNLEYLTIFMNSPEGRKEIFKSMKSTAQPSLSMGTIREIWIPTPPSPEQQRIVIKVHELMAICDQLKTRINEANELQRKIADVVTYASYFYSKSQPNIL
jgi:type I restriction enzyme S subunit